jgi:AGCS family alanine or glycine:cation symporter
MSIDSYINGVLSPVSEALSKVVFASVSINGAELPLIVVWLIAGGLYFTLYLRFINIRGFRQAIRITRGDYANPTHDGEVTHFQALTAALSGTVGLGNIAGVAVAIALGGPGATLWMILAGFLGMSLKFVECTLAVKYRRVNPDGSISGGPMYYLRDGLAKRGFKTLGRGGALFFAIMCIPSSLSFFQVNQAYEQFSLMTGLKEGWIFGLAVAGLTAVVIIGGIKSIGQVTAKLVPLMCGIYVLAGLVILIIHFSAIPAAIWLIVTQAFAPDAVAGGVIGAMVQGFRRAAYSNEAGVGSSPIAHAAVRTNEPVTEGFVALLEPFVDTVIVCTMTALVIVVTGAYKLAGLDGIAVTSAAFESVIWWFPPILTLAVFLFAFSTIITWAYYGQKAWTFMFGESKANEIVFKLLICAAVAVAPSIDLYAIIDFIDAVVFCMAIPNIMALYILGGEVRQDLASYLARVKSGEIAPTRFHAKADYSAAE